MFYFRGIFKENVVKRRQEKMMYVIFCVYNDYHIQAKMQNEFHLLAVILVENMSAST